MQFKNSSLSRLTHVLFGMLALGLAAPLVLLAGAPTTPQTRYPVRIALLSDIHLNRGTNEVLFREHWERAMEAVNTAHVDLVLIAGDLTEDGTPAEYDELLQYLKGFHVPAWTVPGNHDVGNKPISMVNNRVNSMRVARYELKLGPSFFVREHAGVRVIGINSLLLGSGLSAERKQWKMLQQALARPAVKPTILLSHLPPFAKKADEQGGDYWNIEPMPRERLLAMLKAGDVSTVLSGHLHRPLTNNLDGILFYTTPPVSFGLPANKQLPGWTLVTVPQKGPAEVQFKPIYEPTTVPSRVFVQ